MKPVFSKPNSLRNVSTHYCAGCGHGVVHRLIAEIVDEMNIREKLIGIAPVGCAVIAYDYWDFDVTEAAHGRVPAVATGIKRVRPENIVFGYQGDGDLGAIGTAEIIHAANRGENITIIFVNNSVYGMTGGQMAPTTMLKQKTSTTPLGRDQARHGFPLKVCELLSVLPGVCYAERVSIHAPQNILKAKKAIKKAFRNQIDNKGFSIVEVLSQCPTYTGLSPKDAVKWVGEEMTKQFPLGIYK
ncbi:MAG TPA: 2-oxoglutarate oxidoreductase [Candidatus Omnitrophica bacterium]|nr:2-oxoglutarate oxidoreductase [Candidatus Omnitrophota bacterium]